VLLQELLDVSPVEAAKLHHRGGFRRERRAVLEGAAQEVGGKRSPTICWRPSGKAKVSLTTPDTTCAHQSTESPLLTMTLPGL
jgi:hypothetical protein